jgi:hypothetical protein
MLKPQNEYCMKEIHFIVFGFLAVNDVCVLFQLDHIVLIHVVPRENIAAPI